MNGTPASRSRLADDILASLTRLEDRINRTHRSISLITWSLATVAVLQIGAVAAALIFLHHSFSQSMASMGSSIDDSNSGLTSDMAKMMEQLYGLEKKVESRPAGAAPSSVSLGNVQELLNSPDFKNLLQQQSQFMKENWEILEGHKPPESSR